jgi:hypothetical protein
MISASEAGAAELTNDAIQQLSTLHKVAVSRLLRDIGVCSL